MHTVSFSSSAPGSSCQSNTSSTSSSSCRNIPGISGSIGSGLGHLRDHGEKGMPEVLRSLVHRPDRGLCRGSIVWATHLGEDHLVDGGQPPEVRRAICGICWCCFLLWVSGSLRSCVSAQGDIPACQWWVFFRRVSTFLQMYSMPLDLPQVP